MQCIKLESYCLQHFSQEKLLQHLGFCAVLLLFYSLVQIWFGFCSFVSKCKLKCFSTLGILHLLNQLRINRNKDLAIYFHTPKWALSLVHQEHSTITKVTSFPPCPSPLLILIKNPILGATVAHTEPFPSPAHGTSCLLAGSSCTWQEKHLIFLISFYRFPGYSVGSECTYLPLHNGLVPPWTVPNPREIFLMFLCQSKLLYLSEYKKLRLSRFGVFFLFFFPFF